MNRELVAVGYEPHQTRGKTKTTRRAIDLDQTTLAVLDGWRALQAAESAAVGIDQHDGWVFTNGDGDPIHPHSLAQAFARIVATLTCRSSASTTLRHTHGSLLIKEGSPSRCVSERLGHAHIAHTIQTYQHLLPGMGAEAARTYERLAPTNAPGTPRQLVRPRSLTWAFTLALVAGAGFEPATFGL